MANRDFIFLQFLRKKKRNTPFPQNPKNKIHQSQTETPQNNALFHEVHVENEHVAPTAKKQLWVNIVQNN